ncbi:MAG: ABC transporter ATP-binding protein [Alphaproteobacteria bacterium]|nr:ABC transporter ATP-binding protein [Alphaproteobacteria bacterium]
MSGPIQDSPAPLASRELVLRLLREHVRPYAPRLALAAVLMALVAGATALNAWLMQPVLDQVFVGREINMLYLVAGAVLAAAVIKGVATYYQGTIMQGVGLEIVAEVQARLFAHLMRADLAWFHETSSGRLISSFLVDTNALREAVSRALTGMAKDALTVVFLVALMFWQDWRMASVAFVVFPLAAFYIRKFGKRMRRASTTAQEQSGSLTALLAESFQGVRLIKAYGMETPASGKARTAMFDRLVTVMRIVKTRALTSSSMDSLGHIAVAAVILYGGLEVIKGVTTPGTFFSFITALLLAFQPVRSLATLNAALQEGLAAAQRVFALLDAAPTIVDAADAKPLGVSGGAIRFDDVSFAYGAGGPVLRGVSLDIAAGTTLALVGPSGAGKSTLLNLIPRFFDPDQGRVLIDGADIRATTLASLRGAIALVSQEATLFDDTVRANIAFGRPGATDEAIIASAKAAAAHDFIAALPAGYDTVVGESGVKLSGGQRQRLSIARAMLRDAPILLLDEATSALDSESERQVQAALQTLMKGRTTVVIAHRLSTIVEADRIVVLEGGRLVEQGRHAELVSRGGLYARLWALQGAEEGGSAASRAAGRPGR